MRRPLPLPVPALVFALVLGAQPLAASDALPRLGKAALAQQRALQPQRVARAQSHLLALRGQLGLSAREGFTPGHAFTNGQGQTIVQLQHTFEGRRVWGSQAIAHVQPNGEVRALTSRVKTGIALQGAPRLSADQAVAIALQHLAPKGPMKRAPQVEQVVFPAQFLGGLNTVQDPVTGRPVLDRSSVVHARLTGPYAWAYEVRTALHHQEDGPKELAYLIDGNTGALLRVTNLLQNHGPMSGPTTVASNGHGYYRGNVAFNASQMLDGTYALLDSTRGTLPNPGLSWVTPDGSGWTPTGLQVWYEQHDPTGASTYNTFLFQSNPANSWGDGQAFTDWGNEDGTNGQSAGVDAVSAMTTTWDMYQNVFGRAGLDGQGTTPMAYVLNVNRYYIDNAWWSVGEHGMYLGAGSSTLPANHPLYNANGYTSMTDLDVVAHEMTHGLTSPDSTHFWFSGAGLEEGGLNEATSDFFAQMVKAYANRGAGAPDDAIPNTGADWQIGAGVAHGTPLRRMDQPSSDHRSRDGWHDGIGYMDGHFSAGPLNRALYFLAQGASSTPSSPAYSAFLPGGMTGLGNDATARIWLKAVTESLIGDGTGSLTFADAREAALTAATDLYGAASNEVAAVENAFAAVNVGNAHGQGPRVSVRFAAWRNGDWIDANRYGLYSNRQIFPKAETVAPVITVENAANTGVTWSLGGPSMFNGADYNVEEGGVLHPDGTWTTPNRMGWHGITATSQADNHQLAEGRVFLIDMDTDQDLEVDALDMAGIAFSWYLTNGLNPAHSVFEAPWVDDSDVAFYIDAMNATWSVK